MRKILSFVALLVFVTTFATAFSFSDIFNKDTLNAAKKSGDAITKAMENITPEQEYYIGRAVAATILSEYRVLNNQKILTYVKKICNTIVANSDKPELYLGYRILVLDSDEINAFATPGGHIFLTKGIIRCTKNEDALAAVIAHEIAHIQLNHATKAIRSSRTAEAFDSIGEITQTALSKTKLKEVVNAMDSGVGDIMDTLTTSGYSKKQEFEADKKALDLLYDAGYDPKGLVEMLDVLAEKTEIKTGVMSTHPTPKSRISNVKISLMKYKDVTTQDARVERFGTATRGL